MQNKLFRIIGTILTSIFILLGIVTTIAAWMIPNWVFELRLAVTIFGVGFLGVPNALILITLWID
jgi:hypothetical protein